MTIQIMLQIIGITFIAAGTAGLFLTVKYLIKGSGTSDGK